MPDLKEVLPATGATFLSAVARFKYEKTWFDCVVPNKMRYREAHGVWGDVFAETISPQ